MKKRAGAANYKKRRKMMRSKLHKQQELERAEGGVLNPPTKPAWDMYVKFVCVVLFTIYPQLNTTIFKMLRPCHELLNGRRYLHADYSIDCDDGLHDTYWWMAFVFMWMYAFGVPTMYLTLLYRNRMNLYLEVASGTDDCFYSENDNRWYQINTEMEEQLGFLFAAYEPAFWWHVVAVIEATRECARRPHHQRPLPHYRTPSGRSL